jgi:hypothetical protein
MMEAECASEMLVYFSETTQRNIPEGYHLHTCRRENVKSNLYSFVYHSLVTNTQKCQFAVAFATAIKRRFLSSTNAVCNNMFLIRFCTQLSGFIAGGSQLYGSRESMIKLVSLEVRKKRNRS